MLENIKFPEALKKRISVFLIIPPGFENQAKWELLSKFGDEINSESVSTEKGGVSFSCEASLIQDLKLKLCSPSQIRIKLFKKHCVSWEDLSKIVENDAVNFIKGQPKLDIVLKSKSSLINNQKRVQRIFLNSISRKNPEKFTKKLPKETVDKLSEKTKEDLSVDIALDLPGNLSDSGINNDNILRLNLRMFRDDLELSVDASDAPIYKRGYRKLVSKAPIRENLAFLLLKTLTKGMQSEEISKLTLVDPMCGSGVLLSEAALADYSNNYSGLNHQLFKSYWGNDISPRQINNTKINFKPFDTVKKSIYLTSVDVFDEFTLPDGVYGENITIVNPPYGERVNLPATADNKTFLDSLVETICLKLKPRRFGVIALASWKLPSRDLHKGYVLKKVQPFENGGLEVKFLIYFRVG